MYSNPNSMFTTENVDGLKRGTTQLMLGEIIDLEGDGGYKNSLIQQFSVKLQGIGTVLKNCKVAKKNAGYNGTGEFHSYRAGDVIIGVAKDGMLEEFTILGAVNLNGDHKKFTGEGQLLKPGELIDHPYGPAPANQVSAHPSRATKPNAQFNFVPTENIKTEYEDPIYFDDLKDRQNAEPLPGMVLMQTPGGDTVTYGYGSIINYADGNNIILSAGTSENKCTRYLKAAKRHSLISQFLSINTPTATDQYTTGEKFDKVKEIELQPFDTAVLETFQEGEIGITNASVTKAISTALGPPDTKPEGLSPIAIGEKKGNSLIIDRPNSIVPAAYRSFEHARLASLNVAQAEMCNRMMAAMQSQAGSMTPRPGEAGQLSANPAQSQAAVNAANMGTRQLGGFINPCAIGKVFRAGGEFGDPRSYGPHSGIDFGLPATVGTPIVAAADGVVTSAGGGKYNTVIIKHDDVYTTKYLHNYKVYVKAGQTVKKGDRIADVGHTGSGGASNAHLHFDIIKNGVNQNPEIYLGRIQRQGG